YHFDNTAQIGKALSNIITLPNGEVYCQNFSGQILYTKSDSLLLNHNISAAGDYYRMYYLQGKIYTFNRDTIRCYNPITQQTKFFHLPKLIAHITTRVANMLLLIKEDGSCFKIENEKLVDLKLHLKTPFYFVQNTAQGIVLLQKTNNEKIRVIKNGMQQYFKGISDSVFLYGVKQIEDHLYLCTSGGIYGYDNQLNPLWGGRALYADKRISSVMIDAEGAYWISTLDDGILYVPNIQLMVYGLNEYQFTNLAPYVHNKILCGTSKNKLLQFDLYSKTFKLLYKGQNKHEVGAILYDSISKYIVYCADKIYFIRESKLLLQRAYSVKDICVFSPGNFLFSFSNNCCILSPPIMPVKTALPNWLSYSTTDNELFFLGMEVQRTRSVCYSQEDSCVLAAYSNGLFLKNKSGIYELKYKGSAIMSSQLKLANGKVWIATFNRGILCYNIAQNKFTQVPLDTNTSIQKIAVTNEVLCYIADDIICSYNLITGQFKKWSTADGVPAAELKDILIDEGTLYVATSGGLISFPLSLKAANDVAPKIFILQAKNNGVIIDKNSPVFLNSDDNNLEVSFAVPSYKGNQKIVVQYQLNNDRWSTLGTAQRSIKLSHLSAGSYLLKIRAINEDGLLSVNTGQFHFNVLAPFYQKWWFILLLVLATVFIVLGISRYRTKLLVHKQKQALEATELKRQLDLSTLKTLRAQMNPHFIYNALNSIQGYVYSGEKELASKYLSAFSDLSRSLLDSSSATEVSLHEEIKLIDLYLQLECIRLPKIKYIINIADEIEQHMIFIPAMIIQPIVENAIKHGLANKPEDGLLMINFIEQQKTLLITIEDNGIGRKKSNELNQRKKDKPNSYASNAIEDRIALLNKNRAQPIVHTIVDKHQLGVATGTLVTLTIPIDND
ncbi:MAG: histidine kinase, partial [Bacteroidetes bacterium]|nr:histidine kinase [Bacteroidota bacterium]